MEWIKDNFRITTNRSLMDAEYIHEYICNHSYWAPGIPLATVKRSIEHSLCFGVFEAERQIGFARVVTDFATFGYLADVFIDPAFQGRGLGIWLMETIMNHPELQGFRNWMLGTRDAHGLYGKFGFRALDAPERIMRKNDPDVYRSNQS